MISCAKLEHGKRYRFKLITGGDVVGTCEFKEVESGQVIPKMGTILLKNVEVTAMDCTIGVFKTTNIDKGMLMLGLVMEVVPI